MAQKVIKGTTLKAELTAEHLPVGKHLADADIDVKVEIYINQYPADEEQIVTLQKSDLFFVEGEQDKAIITFSTDALIPVKERDNAIYALTTYTYTDEDTNKVMKFKSLAVMLNEDGYKDKYQLITV